MNSDTSLDSYIIPEFVQEKYSLIVDMLKKSKNIDKEEKQYWFGALETMDDDQVQNLKEILIDEQEETKDIAVSEEETKESAEAKISRKKDEMNSQKADTDRQEELLSLLDDL